MLLIWPLLSAIYLIAFPYSSFSDLGFNVQLRLLDTDFQHVFGISSQHLTELGELPKPSSSWFIDIWKRIPCSLKLPHRLCPSVWCQDYLEHSDLLQLASVALDHTGLWAGRITLQDSLQSPGASTYSFSAVLHIWPGLMVSPSFSRSSCQQIAFMATVPRPRKVYFPPSSSTYLAYLQLCFKIKASDFAAKNASCRKTSSYLVIWKEGFGAGWLALSFSFSLSYYLSRRKF